MNDLGRPGKTVCIVLPVIVRTRVVAMLLGDGGDTGIDRTTLADVEGIVTQASAAFERLIVRRKLKGTMPPGAGDSVLPRGLSSMAPPTKHSEISDRPSVEELAAPIRDLMAEPISRVGETIREPHVMAIVPLDTPILGSRTLASDKPPPPAHLLGVTRPSGAPIPREEPDSKPRVPAVTAPSNLGPAAALAHAVVYGASTTGAPSSRSPQSVRGRSRRGEAPKLEFNAVPPPSSMFGGEAFGNDDAERQLLAEIHGRQQSEPPPATSRDESPPVSESGPPSPLSVEVEAPPTAIVDQTKHLAVTVPFRAGAITDRSPGALPMFPAADPVPTSEIPVGAPISSGFASAEVIDAEDSDISVVDQEPTPISPMVDMDGLTPLAPPVSAPVSPAASAKPSTPRAPPVPTSSRPMPASEQQISVAAHRPPSSHNETNVLPSVIVDVASEYVGLVDRVLAGPHDVAPVHPSAEDAESELLRAGGYAMPAIMARFPGAGDHRARSPQ